MGKRVGEPSSKNVKSPNSLLILYLKLMYYICVITFKFAELDLFSVRSVPLCSIITNLGLKTLFF